MQTLHQGIEQGDRAQHSTTNDGTHKWTAKLLQDWRSRLANDCPEQSATTRESIVCWLVGKDLERFEQLNALQLALIQQGMLYRYRILRQRYLGISPKQAYHHLTARLGSIVLLRNKIRALVSVGNDRTSALVDVLQEVIQDLIQRDRYMRQQTAWIAECTHNNGIRTALLMATIEEYCLRPVRNQPLLIYRFVNHLYRTQQGGVTKIPEKNLIKLLSDENLRDESDQSFSFLDRQAVIEYQDAQALDEEQEVRQVVKQEFAQYLVANLEPTAVQWLNLYLQGHSQEAIAHQLNLSTQQVYRLRERVSYHAVRVFGLKHQPELVSNWLENSLQEYNFGLTQQQWQQFWTKLTPRQRQLIGLKKAGENLSAIAQVLNRTINQVTNEWNRLCLAAQALRSKG